MNTQPNISNQTAFEKQLEKRKKEDIRQALRELTRQASRAWQKHLMRRRLTVDQKRLDRLGEDMPRGISRIAALFLGVLPVLAVLVLDYLLLSAVTDYIVRIAYLEGWIVSAAKIAVPLSIVCMELGVCTNLLFARRSAEQWREAPRKSDKKDLRTWKFFSVLPVLVLMSLVVATIMARMEAETTVAMQIDLVSGLLIGAMALLSLLCHATVIFGGARAHEARRYVDFLVRRRRLEWRLKRVERGYVRVVTKVVDQFQVYRDLLADYIDQFPSSPQPEGPFGHPVRFIVNDYFGYEIIPRPESDAPHSVRDEGPDPAPSRPRKVQDRLGEDQGAGAGSARTNDRAPLPSGRFLNGRAKTVSTWFSLLKNMWNGTVE